MLLCAILYFYPAACRPKGHGSSPAITEAAAVAVIWVFPCPIPSWRSPVTHGTPPPRWGFTAVHHAHEGDWPSLVVNEHWARRFLE